MATIPAPHQDSTPGSERSWRIRSGIARTFGSLFLAIGVLLLLNGGELFYDAFAHRSQRTLARSSSAQSA